MPTGSLSIMMEQMPERCFDVGIAEGMPLPFRPDWRRRVWCRIATSIRRLRRAYDNVIHDVALQGLHVVMSGPGRTGGRGRCDAPRVFDSAAMLPVPGLTIASPMDESNCVT